MLVKPPILLTPTPIKHRNYLQSKHAFGALCRSPIISKAVALIGPTNAGKSTILYQCYIQALADFAAANKWLEPVIGMRMATSQDARVSQRYLLLQLLKALRHPTYEHVGELDELEHYLPQGSRNETSMRIAAERALVSRCTSQSYLDEAQHLTHTGNLEFQDRLFQSIKTLLAVDRALFLAGGYELAYNGMFNCAHFSGRLIVVEYPPYREVEDDIMEFVGVLRAWEQLVPVQKELLVKNAIPLLRAHNGIVGSAEAHVFDCKVRAEASGALIDETLLYACMPTRAAQEKIAQDIEQGQEALRRCGKDIQLVSQPSGEGATTSNAGRKSKLPSAESTDQHIQKNRKKKHKPFVRAPKRRATGVEHIKVRGRDRK